MRLPQRPPGGPSGPARALRAAVVGSGPNGLTAACLLARAGWEVTVYESDRRAGGAVRSEELLGEGVVSDLGASAHPLGEASVAFHDLDLGAHGLEWLHPRYPAAHGIDGAAPALLHPSLEAQVDALGADGAAWSALLGSVTGNWPAVNAAAMTPVTRPLAGTLTGRVARDAVHDGAARALALGQLGVTGAWPATLLSRMFRTERARSLFAGLAAHATIPLSHPMTAAFGVIFAAAGHAAGWPVARGGSQAIADALLSCLHAHGGRVVTDFHVDAVEEVTRGGGARTGSPDAAPAYLIGGRRRDDGDDRRLSADQPADAVLLDLSPRQLLGLRGLALRPRYARALRRWNYGPGVVKVDYLVRSGVPWRHPELAEAGTVHLGGSAQQIAASESAIHRGVLPGRPYVLLTQPGAADPGRAPEGSAVLWAYAHVPHGLDAEGTARAARMITAEIERQAPGFGAAVEASHVWGPRELEDWNPNLVGGVISGGMPSLGQFLGRPAWPGVSGAGPYGTGTEGVYLCSASAPPGGGAHGMPGYHAARAVLRAYGTGP